LISDNHPTLVWSESSSVQEILLQFTVCGYRVQCSKQVSLDSFFSNPAGTSYNAFVLFGLQEIPGVPRIKEGYNPATWMLDVTSNMVEQQLSIDFAEIYRCSDLYQ
jgi:hypothetical protein